MSLRPDRDAAGDGVPGFQNRPGVPHSVGILGLLDDPEMIERLQARAAAHLPHRQGQSLTMPSPPPVIQPAPVYESPLDRAIAATALGLGFIGQFGGGRGAGPRTGRPNAVRTRYSSEPDPASPRPPAGQPAETPAATPPRATVDPEGRPLTAPRIFGRDANGQMLPPSPEDVGSLLDALAGGGVTRGLPRDEMPRGAPGTAHVPNYLLGRGERARAAATARIREGEPYGGGVEGHEVGHLTHFIRDGAARLTPRAEKELARLYFAGGYATPERVRDELYAEGIRAYLANGESARILLNRAPTAAALQRRHVNEHPVLSQFYQLNSLFPLGLLGAGVGVGLLDQPDGDSP